MQSKSYKHERLYFLLGRLMHCIIECDVSAERWHSELDNEPICEYRFFISTLIGLSYHVRNKMYMVAWWTMYAVIRVMPLCV